MGGKKKQRTKWRKLSIGGADEQADCGSASPRENNCKDGELKSPRVTSWVAVPLVPLIPVVPVQCYTENGPDSDDGDAKGCYVNGLWIPNSELGRYRNSAPPPPPVGPSVTPRLDGTFSPTNQHCYHLYFVLPKPHNGPNEPYWSQPDVTSPEEQREEEQVASTQHVSGYPFGAHSLYGTVDAYGTFAAVSYHPVVVAPPPLGSRYRCYRGRRKPRSFADFGTDNGDHSKGATGNMKDGSFSGMDGVAARVVLSSMNEAKREILEALREKRLSCLNALAARLLESIVKEVRAELGKLWRVSDAVAASARSLLEITRREEEQRKKADVGEKVHFLGVTATSLEGMLTRDAEDVADPVKRGGSKEVTLAVELLGGSGMHTGESTHLLDVSRPKWMSALTCMTNKSCSCTEGQDDGPLSLLSEEDWASVAPSSDDIPLLWIFASHFQLSWAAAVNFFRFVFCVAGRHSTSARESKE